jgi:very-short-patch-repair endonuclease
MLIIELDGGQHDENKERDANRTQILETWATWFCASGITMC